jgi:hypothetical protein
MAVPNLSFSATPEAPEPNAGRQRFLDDEALDFGGGADCPGGTGLQQRDTHGGRNPVGDAIRLAVALTLTSTLTLILTQSYGGGVPAREQDGALLVRTSPRLGFRQL